MATPAAPTGLFASTGNGQVYLSWDISAGAASYNVLRSTDNVVFASIASTLTNEFMDLSPLVNIEYYYQITATNVDGTSPALTSVAAATAPIGQITLLNLRDQAQQRADMQNSTFISVPEWNVMINRSALELYDLLVDVYEDYFLKSADFVTTGSSTTIPLPDDFYRSRGVDVNIGGQNAKASVKKFMFEERNRYVYPNVASTYFGVFNLQYRITGKELRLIPLPSAGQQITLWYVPRLPTLLKDSDSFDGVSGWEEYIIVDAAIKALIKEESDTTALMLQKEALKQRIQDSAINRDIGQPDRITPTSRNGGGWDGTFGGT